MPDNIATDREFGLALHVVELVDTRSEFILYNLSGSFGLFDVTKKAALQCAASGDALHESA